MSKLNVKRLVGIGVGLLILMAGAAAGGGVVYAFNQTQADDSAARSVEQIVPAEPGIVIASVVPDGPAALAGESGLLLFSCR